MLPPKIQLPPDQQRLLTLFRALPAAGRETLLSFAEFLAQREAAHHAPAGADVVEPVDIPRPASESVVAAIRRLSSTFPMLDRDALLHETADLMSAHVIQGRSAADVIDELEVIFRRHYERVKSGGD
jgi:hypothetical protein